MWFCWAATRFTSPAHWDPQEADSFPFIPCQCSHMPHHLPRCSIQTWLGIHQGNPRFLPQLTTFSLLQSPIIQLGAPVYTHCRAGKGGLHDLPSRQNIRDLFIVNKEKFIRYQTLLKIVHEKWEQVLQLLSKSPGEVCWVSFILLCWGSEKKLDNVSNLQEN